ncbi:hypothetical protein [Amycolatopsis nigrescens]|nr:hypothetical protein [Amycolatopsis nigrescens]
MQTTVDFLDDGGDRVASAPQAGFVLNPLKFGLEATEATEATGTA